MNVIVLIVFIIMEIHLWSTIKYLNTIKKVQVQAPRCKSWSKLCL